MPLEERRRLLSENEALRAELRHARDELRGLLAEATTDELTGLLNRRGFLRIAGEEMHIARAGGRGLTLIYIDVDGLKSVNDCYGHEDGDRLLVETAALLRRVFRETDAVARIGGDEFAVLTRDFYGDGAVLSQRIDDVSRALHGAGMQTHLISLSAGTVVVEPGSHDACHDLMRLADQAMYQIKRSRRLAVLAKPYRDSRAASAATTRQLTESTASATADCHPI